MLGRNCLLQQVIEGKKKGGIEQEDEEQDIGSYRMTPKKGGGGGRKIHLKEEALDRTMWRAQFGIGLGPVMRQTPN
jgi:hypothetical protein